MSVEELTCPSCSAPLEIPANADRFYCQYCGALLVVDNEANDAAGPRGARSVRLLDASGKGGDGSEAELKRLGLVQMLADINKQLAEVQAELRELGWNPRGEEAERRQKDLKVQEATLEREVATLQMILNPNSFSLSNEAGSGTRQEGDPIQWIIRLLVAIPASLFVFVLCIVLITPAVERVAGSSSKGYCLVCPVELLIPILVFLYVLNPYAKAWGKLRRNRSMRPPREGQDQKA